MKFFRLQTFNCVKLWHTRSLVLLLPLPMPAVETEDDNNYSTRALS